MTTAWVPLAEITLTSTDSEITFGSIPQTYRDLIVVFQGGNTGAAANIYQKLNSDATTSNYSSVQMTGTGSSALSSSPSGGATWTVTFYGYLEQNLNANVIVQLQDYSATNKHKTYLSRSNSASNGLSAIAGRWADTSAVTSISWTVSSGEFRIGSTFALYGSNKL